MNSIGALRYISGNSAIATATAFVAGQPVGRRPYRWYLAFVLEARRCAGNRGPMHVAQLPHSGKPVGSDRDNAVPASLPLGPLDLCVF